ncbi:zinc finger MYM-type protein 2-like [Saccostrea cucullata]|uniref:zinc finger MYM-type protein 2-like n=1 Tax=Saccostrea cuccullata TaxID=36930 RepID=UPI002ED36123
MYKLSQSDLNDQDFGNFDIQDWCLEAFPELKQENFTKWSENTTTRFEKPVSATEISALKKNQESKNTRRNTSWAVKVFNDWKSQRNQQQPGDFKIIPEILRSTYQELAYTLSCFVIETRRADDSPYPPRTLYQIGSGILRYMREEGVHDMNFLDVKDARFHDFRKTLDARMKELASQGIGVSITQADPLTPEQEDVLWEKKLLGAHTSKSYINTEFLTFVL